jgi:hypothetical protein
MAWKRMVLQIGMVPTSAAPITPRRPCVRCAMRFGTIL